ncbi:MAG: hypothetical protein K8F92_02485 [Hyphomicrobium sp.]|uniref:hypothetical protein n=1 Tax=Hyphomicrobium sp. TaxID=82 RepID=UPI00132B0D19|nr:hypothetical protein [Hyphomicrobium sp.]KAB2942538.1 MAG: hypothetical protein F9K20_05995 [Hyphomicrobium sp.]MBZ0208509.1 hypothetical protein [Hyphomicrobium sp.]
MTIYQTDADLFELPSVDDEPTWLARVAVAEADCDDVPLTEDAKRVIVRHNPAALDGPIARQLFIQPSGGKVAGSGEKPLRDPMGIGREARCLGPSQRRYRSIAEVCDYPGLQIEEPLFRRRIRRTSEKRKLREDVPE